MTESGTQQQTSQDPREEWNVTTHGPVPAGMEDVYKAVGEPAPTEAGLAGEGTVTGDGAELPPPPPKDEPPMDPNPYMGGGKTDGSQDGEGSSPEQQQPATEDPKVAVQGDGTEYGGAHSADDSTPPASDSSTS